MYGRCDHGFILNGESCDDIDECSDGTHFCRENTECNNLIGSYECTGTGGDGDDECKDVECPDKTECVSGECVDVNECRSPDLNRCQSFETCVNANPGYSCEFTYGQHCPNEKYEVDWKGVCSFKTKH